MHTSNEIDIWGEPERVRQRVFQLAADIQDWPAILPHYRYMRVLECTDRNKVADFGATRDGFPVKWRARQELFPDEWRITFHHIGGITKGMWVEWKLQMREGCVHVSIEHELNYPLPLLGPFFARYIVGRLFVQNIAGKTLRCMKARVEAEDGNTQPGSRE